MSSSISNLAILYMDVGETAHARKLREETMELDQERGDEWGVAVPRRVTAKANGMNLDG